MNLARRMMKSIFGLVVLLTMCAGLSLAGLPDKDKAQGLQKTTTNDVYRPFLINNIFNYYGNNGDGSYNKFSSDNEGFEFLKGDGKHIIFEDGVVWGGYHKGRAQAKVGGSVYRHGLQAGPIITNGTATADPVAASADDAAYRVYRVRPDINPNVEFSAVEDKIKNEEVYFIGRYESYSAQDIYNQYIKDWNEWPANLGAPFAYGKDANGDQRSSGPYDPRYDIPGQPGSDQTLWYVANDCSQTRVTNLAGCPLIGLEMQRTIWGYKRSGALGQTIFASSIVINKSGARVDSMYLVQWADPDLGDAGDDFAGCDTSRSLGYIYNGKAVDGTYGTAVPAGGFTFFQGPIVAGAPTDSAIFKLKYRHGYKNLKMSAFVIFSQGIPSLTDPRQGPNGDFDWYNLMRGLIAASGNPFIDPTTNLPTKFVVAGDPVTGTGYIDGMGGLTPQDRRICLVTGPFTFAPGDTQELVVANLAGVGADRLSSITAMRSVSDLAQSAYNSLFKLPAPPPSPVVNVANLDGQVVLSWGDPITSAKTETAVDQGFTFEGYKVYELPGPSSAGAVLLGTWDMVDGITAIVDTVRDPTGYYIPTILQRGNDTGPIRSMSFKSSKTTGGPLINGTNYYYAVTAYSYNPAPPPAAGTHSLESPIQVITGRPQSANPGTRYLQTFGDTLRVTATVAPGGSVSDGKVVPLVIDPTRLTGDTYNVTFQIDTASGATVWSLKDVTKNVVLAKAQTNQTGNEDYLIADGVMVKVLGPAPGMKRWDIPSGSRRFSPVGGFSGLGLEGFGNSQVKDLYDEASGTIGMAGHLAFGGIGTTLSEADYHNVLLKLAAVDPATLWDPKATPTDTNFSRAYRFLRAAGSAAADPSFVPWIVNTGSGYPFQGYDYSVPFSAWDMETTPPTRLAVGSFENNVVGGKVDGRYWPGVAGVDDNSTLREFAFIYKSPYTTTENPALAVNMSNNATTPLMWVMTCNRNADATWVAGDQFLITANHVNSVFHTFSYVATKPTVGDVTLAKVDINRINVYPNPYIGFNPAEINKYARFVTFNHLPVKATVRIFNLAGVLVKTIQKNDQSQYATWDLKNEAGFPASAGMYIAYIDMPDLGVTKTLKLGIIPEQQTLDRW